MISLHSDISLYDSEMENKFKILGKLLGNFNKIRRPSGFISLAGILVVVLMIGSVNACNHNCSNCSDCGAKITDASSEETICLNQSILNHSGTCINNPANFTNKTFDCQGHTMEGTGFDYGIYLENKNNITIKNCNVMNYEYGIYLENSSHNTLRNNTANNNTGDGIYLSSSPHNTLINNTANSNTGGGIILFCSPNNTLINNIANNNQVCGYVKATELQMKVKASSVEDCPNNESCEPENAIDRDMSTRWSSEWSDPQWLEIDLGDCTEILGLILKWENASGKNYSVLLSENGSEWQEVYNTTEGDGRTDIIYFNKTNARFLKIDLKKRGTTYGYSLYEVAILHMKVNASSVQDIDNNECCTPEKAIDGNMSTRWSSQSSDPQWFKIDLGEVKNVTGVTLKWEAAYGKKYSILLSENESDWWEVYNATEGDGITDDIYFNKSEARFLKFELKEREYPGWGYSLWEVSIKGLDEEPIINASSSQDQDTAKNVMDGSRESGWHSNETEDEQWLMIDFHYIKGIGGLDIFWDDTDYATSYEIWISNNTETWVLIYNETEGRGGKDRVFLQPTSAQFIKILNSKKAIT